MAKILRKTQKIFGQNGATDEFAQFGTMKLIENGGTPTYSKDIEVLQNNAAFLLGWQNAVIAGFAPFLEELNALSYILTTQMAYILQNGIPEWDAGTTYYINSIVVGSNSKIYRCKTDDCLNVDPTTDDGTNWYDYELNAANLALSNLTSDGIDFINQSKALETGSVSSNSTVYADIHKYNHSTFDSSKFTISGTPTITNDGIASGFSNSNFLTTPNIDFSGNTTKVRARFKTGTLGANTQLIFDSSYVKMRTIYVSGETKHYLSAAFSDGTYLTQPRNTSEALQENTEYIAEIELVKGVSARVTLYNADGTIIENSQTSSGQTKSVNIPNSAITANIGYANNNYFTGSIDLKKIEVLINGYCVFNGNKTGIDTIKPDDYTVVGTPTISADGVLTSYSTSNYLKKSVSITGNEIKIKCGFTIAESMPVGDQYSIIQSAPNTAKFYLSVRNIGGVYKIATYLSDNTVNGFSGLQNLVVGVNYVAELTFNISEHTNTTTLYKADGTLVGTNSYTLTGALSNWTSINELQIGNTNTNAKVYVDLNTIEAYSDGDLVYQPCLKIPYTLSKTGSKVVDVYARNRVASMYEQYGYAPYYTIDEANQNYTLPMGEVYGLMNQKTNEAPLIKAYGVSINGALTNTNGVLSGFSASIYAIVSGAFNPANSTWEMNFKVTTGASVSGEQEVFSDGNNGLELQLYNAKWALEFNGNTVGTGTYTVLANTTYYLRLKFTGSAYTLEYSTDGSAYTTDITYSNSTAYTGGILFLGLDKNIESQAWGGSIDLNKCNIKINNTLSWQGIEPKDNVYVINDRPAVVIESFNNGSAWYRLYSDGWCEQGGIIPVGMVTGTSGEHLINVNLLKAYATSNFHINGTAQGDGVTSYILYDIVIVPYSKNTNSVTFSVSPTASNSFFVPYFYWEAKGYTK